MNAVDREARAHQAWLLAHATAAVHVGLMFVLWVRKKEQHAGKSIGSQVGIFGGGPLRALSGQDGGLSRNSAPGRLHTQATTPAIVCRRRSVNEVERTLCRGS